MKSELLWKGRPLLNKDDAFDLDRQSAIHELKHGHSQEQAEEIAYSAYKQQAHLDAAAYHLVGLAAAKGSKNDAVAQKHLLAYGLHVKQLGLNPSAPPTEDIVNRMEKYRNVYGFKPHNADIFGGANDE